MILLSICQNPKRLQKQGQKIIHGPCVNRAYATRTVWEVAPDSHIPKKRTLTLCWECAGEVDKLRKGN